MKSEIKVPSMGESITEVTVGQILKPSGSHVKVDEEILELETDKVNQVLYAPATGVLTLNVKTDATVKVGDVIGHVDLNGEAAPEEKAKPTEKKKPEAEKKEDKPAPVEKQPVASNRDARITKKAFIEDLSEEKPAEKETPPQKQQQPKPKPAPFKKIDERETRRRMTKIRRTIAERMVSAQQTTAMLTTFNEVDMTEVMNLRKKYQEIFQKEHGVKLGFMSFFVKACVAAMAELPDLNSYIDGDEIVHREYYDIGVAVGTDRGVFVPVIRDCDLLSYAQIEKEIIQFAKSARDGTISPDDLKGGGFTITNGGVYGSLMSTPILNPPQSGILGLHKIQDRPVAVDGQIVIKPMMYLALSYDHRIVDGKEAVTFLVNVKNYLEDPARNILEV